MARGAQSPVHTSRCTCTRRVKANTANYAKRHAQRRGRVYRGGGSGVRWGARQGGWCGGGVWGDIPKPAQAGGVSARVRWG